MSNTKTGRKPAELKEITDRNFTIRDLESINTNVKSPTVRMYVKRNLQSGRYIVAGTLKSGGRGKPSTTYAVVNVTNTKNTESV
jgi:hypothetical protein